MPMREILGNTNGIKEFVLQELRKLYDLTVPSDQLLTEELGIKLVQLTILVKREISIYLSRGGEVSGITLGTNERVQLPPLAANRFAADRLCGIRCLHTHPSGIPELSSLDLSVLKNNRLDAMVALGVNTEYPEQSALCVGMITGLSEGNSYHCEVYGPFSLLQAEKIAFSREVMATEKNLQPAAASITTASHAERAILVALDTGGQRALWTSEDSLSELVRLADTAGAVVVAKFLQKRPKPDPAFLIGRGKVEELALCVQQENISLCVFDEELSPAQQRNIEAVLGIKTIDRTNLVLDIFAQRAVTNEGKLQVELAQLQYNLPRIMGQGLILSRLGGGIGTRGPGETKLETDRRHIRTRISYLQECLHKIGKVRTTQKGQRTKNQIPEICLVGYTNAGKSTLLNTLTQSDIYTRDQLFATLDPTSRQLILPDKQKAVLTDTVGFIQRLPHQLVAAFKSTLEVVKEADLLLHVVDISQNIYEQQSQAVYKVLSEIGAVDKNILTVYNKIDCLPEHDNLMARLRQHPDSVCISAASGIGIPELLEAIAARLQKQMVNLEYLFPYDQSQLVNQLYEYGKVGSIDYLDEGIKVAVALNLKYKQLFSKYQR